MRAPAEEDSDSASELEDADSHSTDNAPSPASATASAGAASNVSLASMDAKEGLEFNLHWESHVRVGSPYRLRHKGDECGEQKESGECNFSKVE